MLGRVRGQAALQLHPPGHLSGLPGTLCDGPCLAQQSSQSQDRQSESREKRDILSFDKIKEQRERERQRQREREIRETERRR